MSGHTSGVDASREPLTAERLERWTLFGATWRIVELSRTRAVVDLCTCTGELVEQAASEDPGVIEYVRRHEPLSER